MPESQMKYAHAIRPTNCLDWQARLRTARRYPGAERTPFSEAQAVVYKGHIRRRGTAITSFYKKKDHVVLGKRVAHA
jgi:hypothetical protein